MEKVERRLQQALGQLQAACESVSSWATSADPPGAGTQGPSCTAGELGRPQGAPVEIQAEPSWKVRTTWANLTEVPSWPISLSRSLAP